MSKSRVNIAIFEPSDIIVEGITNITLRSSLHYSIYRVEDFDELRLLAAKKTIQIVIANPSFVQNRIAAFTKLKAELSAITWFCLLYSYTQNEVIGKFDKTIQISDSEQMLLEKVNTAVHAQNKRTKYDNHLSDREQSVLIELINGLSNKEAADKLNISIHTVITHRKNITDKTGIKSLSGLTIYAISKNIIQID